LGQKLVFYAHPGGGGVDVTITKAEFEKKKYRFHGNSAVQICTWSKKALKGGGECYKQKFYGVPTHRCMQFSPSALFCQNHCIYCWRPAEYLGLPHEVQWDAPAGMVEALVSHRVKLLEGFGGNPKAGPELYREALEPVHFAISLSGEPTLYSQLPELVTYLRKRPKTFSVFIVTNGQEPDMLKQLQAKHSLPTQLYLSLSAHTKEAYRKIVNPGYADGWKRMMASLHFLSKVPTRTVLRITLIKGMNMDLPKDWAGLIWLANPHFVEFKAYTFIGHSRQRMQDINVPTLDEVRDFASEVAGHLHDQFETMDEDGPSRIVVMRNTRRTTERLIKGPDPTQNGF